MSQNISVSSFRILGTTATTNRYNAYYNYYGPDAPETKQAEADSK